MTDTQVISSIPRSLWKLTIDPRGKADPEADSFAFCMERGIIGIGWRLENPPPQGRLVRQAFKAECGGRFPAAMNMIANRAAIGDHVWLYRRGKYFIARILGDWEHRDGTEWRDHDIHNVRRAEWRAVDEGLVPGIVRRKLTMYGTAQRITQDQEWCAYSAIVFGDGSSISRGLTAEARVRLSEALRGRDATEVFSVLDADEIEDLVCLYLQQDLGWRIIKSSTYRSQRDTECILRKRSTDGALTGYVQVKSGRTKTLDPSSFAPMAESGTVYLFSTAKRPYKDTQVPGVELLRHETIVDFLARELDR